MLSRLLWLSVGTFVIGTEGFVVAGVLPDIAADVHVQLAVCGQLVTVFALAYAIGSPVLSTLLGAYDRRVVLLGALVAFALSNFLAAAASSLPLLMGARVLLALSAGLFVPTANAVAVALVPPAMRGRAIATVIGGMTVAVAFGAPLGTLLADYASWRATFAAIGAVSLVASLGLFFGLPKDLPRTFASLRERVALAAEPAMLVALLSTVFWSMASFTLFTYLTALIVKVQLDVTWITAALLLFGVSAAIGNVLGGYVVDRIGPARTIAGVLTVLVLDLLAVSVTAKLAAPPVAGIIVLALIVPWGIAGWAFYPAQSSRLVGIAPNAAVVALSLNSSALYLGTAVGATLGGLTVGYGDPSDLGFVAAACMTVALAIFAFSQRSGRPVMQPGE